MIYITGLCVCICIIVCKNRQILIINTNNTFSTVLLYYCYYIIYTITIEQCNNNKPARLYSFKKKTQRALVLLVYCRLQSVQRKNQKKIFQYQQLNRSISTVYFVFLLDIFLTAFLNQKKLCHLLYRLEVGNLSGFSLPIRLLILLQYSIIYENNTNIHVYMIIIYVWYLIVTPMSDTDFFYFFYLLLY